MSGWHKEDIKAALRKKFGSMEAWAEQEGLVSSIVRRALLKPSPSVDRKIAKALGVAPHKIWPDRYEKSGERKRNKRNSPTVSVKAQVAKGKPSHKPILVSGEDAA